ncbi:MAG TPA: GspH/FimT family pseudopilin [Thermodesulfovibrionales bacterium]|nr:GspH/FimT family pseudopilin [Thermodesulfovibrionales bacterium]
MKDCRGVTLVELIVVVSIVAILATALGFQFTGWMKSYRIESEVKQMYTDLTNARLQAMQQNTCQFLVFTATTYQLFQDKNGNCLYDAGTDTSWKAFASAVKLTDSLTSTGTVITDTKGLVSLSPAGTTIQVNDGTNASPDYDCLLLEQTRIKIGKWSGGSCNAN